MPDLIHWHTLDGKLLNEHSVVVDLGANRGEFLAKMQSRFGCKAVAVEPNPALFEQLPKSDRLVAINAAAGGHTGQVGFLVDDNDLASRVVEGPSEETFTVDLLTLHDIFERAGIMGADLLKIDIEGQEVALLDAASDDLLKSVGQITIEFHDFCGLVPKAEVARIIKRLEGLGFYSAKMSRIGHQDTWLLNTNKYPLGVTDRVKVKLQKYGRGFMRVWHKLTRGDEWYLAYDRGS